MKRTHLYNLLIAFLIGSISFPITSMDRLTIARTARNVITKNKRGVIAAAGLIAGTVGIIALVNSVREHLELTRIKANREAQERAAELAMFAQAAQDNIDYQKRRATTRALIAEKEAELAEANDRYAKAKADLEKQRAAKAAQVSIAAEQEKLAVAPQATSAAANPSPLEAAAQ